MTYLEAISTPITTHAEALAFLQALVEAGKTYHLEDSAHDMPWIFPGEQAALVEARVNELYYKPWWSYCPIAAMNDLEAKHYGFETWEEWQES